MALQIKNFDFNGIPVDAYCRIGETYWNKNEPLIFCIRMDFYSSQLAFEEGRDAIASERYAINLPLDQSENQLSQLFNQTRGFSYLAMRQIPIFAEAIDC